MSELIATPVVKNKFWVVEDSGNKIATIQAREDGGFVYVYNDRREYFSSTHDLKQKLNIKFSTSVKKNKDDTKQIYGYPAKGKIYNQLFDVKRKIPIYTKQSKSKSFYCAGFYLVKQNNIWTEQYCPKNITLQRYEFFGPFATKEEMIQYKDKNDTIKYSY